MAEGDFERCPPPIEAPAVRSVDCRRALGSSLGDRTACGAVRAPPSAPQPAVVADGLDEIRVEDALELPRRDLDDDDRSNRVTAGVSQSRSVLGIVVGEHVGEHVMGTRRFPIMEVGMGSTTSWAGAALCGTCAEAKTRHGEDESPFEWVGLTVRKASKKVRLIVEGARVAFCDPVRAAPE